MSQEILKPCPLCEPTAAQNVMLEGFIKDLAKDIIEMRKGDRAIRDGMKKMILLMEKELDKALEGKKE